MKHIFLFVVCITTSGTLLAQHIDTTIVQTEIITLDSVKNDDTIKNVLITDIMKNAIIHQDSAIYRLMMDKYLGIERGQQEVSGFRVQVYSSNQQQQAKSESISLQQGLEKKLSQPVYVISEPPFWKVRIGNFRTRDEANQYKKTLLDLYPELQSSTYVVPDKVIVLN